VIVEKESLDASIVRPVIADPFAIGAVQDTDAEVAFFETIAGAVETLGAVAVRAAGLIVEKTAADSLITSGVLAATL
jgi:hypothetical protein